MDAATLQSDSKSNLGNYLVDEIYTATQLSTSLHSFLHRLQRAKFTFLTQNKLWLVLK